MSHVSRGFALTFLVSPRCIISAFFSSKSQTKSVCFTTSLLMKGLNKMVKVRSRTKGNALSIFTPSRHLSIFIGISGIGLFCGICVLIQNREVRKDVLSFLSQRFPFPTSLDSGRTFLITLLPILPLSFCHSYPFGYNIDIM